MNQEHSRLQYELNSEQSDSALLAIGGLRDHLESHRMAQDRFHLDRAPGNGSEISQEGLKAVNRQAVMLLLVSGLAHGGPRALGRCTHAQAVLGGISTVVIVKENRLQGLTHVQFHVAGEHT